MRDDASLDCSSVGNKSSRTEVTLNEAGPDRTTDVPAPARGDELYSGVLWSYRAGQPGCRHDQNLDLVVAPPSDCPHNMPLV